MKVKQREITIRLPLKTARKLSEALSNRPYDKLTTARAAALVDFICELQFQIGMAEADSGPTRPPFLMSGRSDW